MALSPYLVDSPRLWPLLLLSLALHGIAVGAVVSLERTNAMRPIPPDHVVLSKSAEAADRPLTALPIDVESEPNWHEGVAAPRAHPAAPAVPAQPQSLASRVRIPHAPPIKPPSAEPRGDMMTDNEKGARPPESAASQPAAATSTTEVMAMDRQGLLDAMQAAAQNPSSADAISQPIIRVDPGEKNLDRALARAFAWAFAVDRSLFESAPLGSGRFVIEIGPDGRIRDVTWPDAKAPPRLRQLVGKMARLLSVNHFQVLYPDETGGGRRGFRMTVTQSKVAVPAQAGDAEARAGDIWMLAAGEVPTVGHPSHPAVADATGRKISCELDVLETTASSDRKPQPP